MSTIFAMIAVILAIFLSLLILADKNETYIEKLLIVGSICVTFSLIIIKLFK